jgi:hypothetical protein
VAVRITVDQRMKEPRFTSDPRPVVGLEVISFYGLGNTAGRLVDGSCLKVLT